MTTSVVILSHQPGDWLHEAIVSVIDQADEVVLVDNGSNAATASRIGRELGAYVVRSEANLGFAGGVNLGARRASGDVLALLNDDATAPAGWLAASVAALEAPDVAAVTPKVRYRGWYQEIRFDDEPWSAPGDERILGRRLSSVMVEGADVLARLRGPGVHRLESEPSGHPPRWRWTRPGRPVYVPVPEPGAAVVVDGDPATGAPCRLLNKAGTELRADGTLGDVGDGEPDGPQWDRPGEQFFASGTAVALRADTFARIGGLAEPFFAYYEDADWSWRGRLAGMRILFDPGVAVDHRHSATSGGPEASLARWVQRTSPRNELLTLVRNAPLRRAERRIRRRFAEPDPGGARAAFVRLLPWALASRRSLSRQWVVSPAEIWDRWATPLDAPAD